jgi:hypothetical protein
MNAVKHTPGPWVVESGRLHHYIKTESGRDVAEVINPIPYKCERSLADAHLIAAAPDLLEALQLVMHEVVESGNDTQQFGWGKANAAARAAIAKATPEKQASALLGAA